MKAKKVRYAVVGLGWITQEAILPAFAHAKENSELVALVSDDQTKLEELGRKYKVPHLYSYAEYGICLRNGDIDAVYIGLPNHLHREYVIQAAEAGIHVLCEKPLAMTQQDCRKMIQVAQRNQIKFMTAYRLHFEEGNLKAIDIAQSNKIGDVRIFNSTFTMSVEAGNVRLSKERGGGTLYDIGIYCINAARGIFRAEPTEVFAFSAQGRQKRFAEVDEMTSAILRFSDDRLASFTCSFGAASTSAYEIIGTKGSLRVEPAYNHRGEVKHVLTVGEKEKKETFRPRDQFAPEIIYFSRCILQNKNPEPSGVEGLADVRIIEALYRSARRGKPVSLKPLEKNSYPRLSQAIHKPKVKKPKLIKAKGPISD